MTCLFVGNITSTVTENQLVTAFSAIGPCKVELKGKYAFIEYENPSDSKEAMKKLNKTTLNGANGFSKLRIEFSKKKKVNDKLEDNDNNINPLKNQEDIDLSENSSPQNSPVPHPKVRKGSLTKTKREEEDLPKKNVCFICKLPGHFAKECVLTRDSCYECGEKGHMAKECQAGVREAKTLTKNRVKAVFSQQSAYRFLTPKSKITNIISYIQENVIN